MTPTSTPSPAGSITLIGGGPGAWDLITVRGMHRVQAADVILVDHLGPGAELEKLCDLQGKEIIDVSKLPYGKQVAQEKINELLVEKARAGLNVARLKGGDPYVFGRGFEELQACTAAGLEVEVIPGVTSAISVPAAAQVPITQRAVVHCFTVVSGHIPPGHPKSLIDWKALAHLGGTISIIMGVKNGPAIAAELIAHGMDPQTPTAVVEEGTTTKQRSFRGTLATLGEMMKRQEITPPAVIVIGEVAGLGL